MREDSANTVRVTLAKTRKRSLRHYIPFKQHECNYGADCYHCYAMQLEGLTHEQRKPHGPVKSSLKGSRSHLSLEEVAIAARKNAARRHTRTKADTVLRSLLSSAENKKKASPRFLLNTKGHLLVKRQGLAIC